MQKTGAFAFASLWMMMWVAPSVAAAGIELYGVADAFVKFGEWRGDQTVGVDDSWFSGDRIGLRGKESLGDGLVATFVLEQGYALDTGKSEVMSREDSLKNEGSEVLTRQAWVGLEGAFGAGGRWGGSTRRAISPTPTTLCYPPCPVRRVGFLYWDDCRSRPTRRRAGTTR